MSELDYLISMASGQLLRKLYALGHECASKIQYISIEEIREGDEVKLNFKDSEFGISFSVNVRTIGAVNINHLNHRELYLRFKELKFKHINEVIEMEGIKR